MKEESRIFYNLNDWIMSKDKTISLVSVSHALNGSSKKSNESDMRSRQGRVYERRGVLS